MYVCACPSIFSMLSNLKRVVGGCGGGVRQAHAQGLYRGGHGVGRIHPTAGSGTYRVQGYDHTMNICMYVCVYSLR